MQTRTYTERSNARRAARAAGLDPDTAVITCEDGFEVCFEPRDQHEPQADNSNGHTFVDKQRVVDASDPTEAGVVVRAGPEQSEVRGDDGKTRVVSNDRIKPAATDDGLDIPEFCKLSPAQRRESWIKNPPLAAAAKPKETTPMPKSKTKTPKGPSGSDKNATLLKMLAGKGSTVEQMTKALDWLPHTLRARISRLAKPKSKGGDGLKIERERVDGVTSYRIA